MRVEDLLQLSPLRLITARPDTPVAEAARRMAKYGVGIVVVMDDDDAVAGVLSERDLVVALGAADGAVAGDAVGGLMTETVVTIAPEASLVDAVLTMNAHGIRHLIAAKDGRPVGVVSIRDVLRVFARQLLDEGGAADGALTLSLAKALAA